MKKIHIIFISVTTIAIIIGAFALNYFMSLHKVTFVVKQDDLTVSIYNKSGDSKINSFKSNKFNLSLSNGDYYYIVGGKNIDTTKYSFSVKDSNTIITADPDYSSSYLISLLKTDQDSILSIIKNAYPSIINDYTITNMTLFKKGEWCGAIIRKNVNSRDITDSYRIILKKENDKWTMIHYPEIVVTKANFADVPTEVLNAVNNLTFG